CARGGTFAYW
nr:immunoglobulin heavy chain junction region [Mus musculus]MBK4197514.1 immunoglobulin heavy chain junction region [Mus musculus]MBK4197515.1 immunoglobulin heavy chain junction region [Mus musculus]